MVKMRVLICFIFLGYIFALCDARVLDQKQKKLVDELRKELQNKKWTNAKEGDYAKKWLIKRTDGQLYNWIEYAEDDLDKAENYIEENLRWRIEEDIDSWKSWDKKEKYRDLDFALTGFNDAGDAIIYVAFGKWNIESNLAGGMTQKDIVNEETQFMELAMNTPNPKTGKLADNMVVVVDIEGFSVSEFLSIRALSTQVQFGSVYMTRYPHFAKRAIIIRKPYYFDPLWAAVKVVMSQKVADSFTLHGVEDSEWRPVLEENIPKSAIPDFLGGQAKVNYATHGVDGVKEEL